MNRSLPGPSDRPLLLLGGSGLLGQACRRLLEWHDVPLWTPARDELDLARPAAAETAIREAGPRLVINAAAFADVARAEQTRHREEVFAVNRDGAAAVARASKALGCMLLHVSTDYVFDGAKRAPYVEDDPVNPLQIYGQSKLEGERAVREAHESAVIVRTATLFGPGRPAGRSHYVDAILRQAHEGDRLSVVEPPVSSPCYAPDLAQALVDLATRRATGTVHVVNDGHCSRLELARRIVGLAGLADRVRVDPRPPEPGSLRRPAYSALDTSRFAGITGGRLRSWDDALQEYLEQRA